MMRRICLTAIVLLMVPLSAVAQQQGIRDGLLDRLAGDWVMTGTIAGAAVTHDIKSEWVLEHNYIRFHEVSRERTESGSPQYEAIVFIGRHPQFDGYACLWLDSTGWEGLDGRVIGHAKPEKDRLAFVFELVDGGKIHNTLMHRQESDTWDWHIDLEDESGRREFARVELTRKRP